MAPDMWELTLHEEGKADRGVSLYIWIQIVGWYRSKRSGETTGPWGGGLALTRVLALGLCHGQKSGSAIPEMWP